MKIATVQHITATNDRNGNPRRLFLVTRIEDDGAIVARTSVQDEGYEGRLAVVNPLKERGYAIIDLPTVEVEPREYRRLLAELEVTP